ncbi:MAG: hypothetical protein JWO98_1713, partial [Frankiales bacterium]|nr:hypothetical protein [Frankiales bacterium]
MRIEYDRGEYVQPLGHERAALVPAQLRTGPTGTEVVAGGGGRGRGSGVGCGGVGWVMVVPWAGGGGVVGVSATRSARLGASSRR